MSFPLRRVQSQKPFGNMDGLTHADHWTINLAETGHSRIFDLPLRTIHIEYWSPCTMFYYPTLEAGLTWSNFPWRRHTFHTRSAGTVRDLSVRTTSRLINRIERSLCCAHAAQGKREKALLQLQLCKWPTSFVHTLAWPCRKRSN